MPKGGHSPVMIGLAILIALGAVIALYLLPGEVQISPKPPLPVVVSRGPDSIPTMSRPPGFGAFGVPTPRVERLAKKHSTDDLVARWQRVPSGAANRAKHADFARALGQRATLSREQGEGVDKIVAALAPFAQDSDAVLRRGALEGLMGTGKEALPALLNALAKGGEQGAVRRDLLETIAQIQELRDTLKE